MAEGMLRTREEALQEDTWALEDLYESDEAWEADFGRLEREIPQLRQYEGCLGEGALVLLKMQRKWDELNELAERVYV